MNVKSFFLYILIFIFLSSCSNKNENIEVLNEKSLETQMIETYNEAMKEFNRGDVIYAGKNLMKLKLFSLNQFGRQEQY